MRYRITSSVDRTQLRWSLVRVGCESSGLLLQDGETGKRGAVRVGYLFLQEHETVVLVIAYSKSEKDNLTSEEKSAIRRLIENVREEYASGQIR